MDESRTTRLIVAFAVAGACQPALAAEAAKILRAGAAAVNITPSEFPVRVAGNFFEQSTTQAHDPLHARCLVLDDGSTRVAIAVVDNCVIPRDLFDEAKLLARKATGIPMEQMLMSATHTHSGPPVVSLLGTEAEEGYRRSLPPRIAEAVKQAVSNLTPARIGWAVVRDTENTHCRRWIRRPDRIGIDPFGHQSIRAMMHPGHQNPDYLGPSGPVDPDISILSVQSPEGRPIALLANYSMHYVGALPLSADYFGAFAERVRELVAPGDSGPHFVAMMSNGTSGDLQFMDYSMPAVKKDMQTVADAIARKVFEAYQRIKYDSWVPLVMRETKLPLSIRPIDDDDLARAQEVSAKLEGRKPRTLPELYAREQVLLNQMPPTHELRLQALRIGDLGVVAIPCELFGITGLKIKAYSPLRPTFTIELANGYCGYVPPPEQHALGGYTTWRARSACLEVAAEPRIVTAVLDLLEQVSGRQRRPVTGEEYPLGDYPTTVLAAGPAAYWRLNEFSGPAAMDASGHDHHGRFEPGVAFYLDGPGAPATAERGWINRAPHFAGGRMMATIKGLSEKYTVEMWFNNYLPVDARPVTGYLFSRGSDGARGAPGEHLAIGGTSTAPGKLLFYNGDVLKEVLSGTTAIGVQTWNHLVMVRDGRKVAIYLNGAPTPEISGEAAVGCPSDTEQVFIAGRNDGFAGFEGRMDEVAVYDRTLSAEEVARHYRASLGKGEALPGCSSAR